MDQKVIGFIIGALILGGIVGYFIGGSQVGQQQTEVASLTSQVASLQSQVTTLQLQVTTLQSDKTNLQSQVTTLQGQVTSLQSQVTSLQADKTRLISENTALRQNITAIMDELTRLRAIHTYTAGSVLTTLSGGEEDKTGPAFYIPGGHIKITAQLTSLGEIRGFYIRLYKVGQKYSVWSASTENAGTYENYVYSLEPGDYYLDVSSVNFNWQVTVYVYG